MYINSNMFEGNWVILPKKKRFFPRYSRFLHKFSKKKKNKTASGVKFYAIIVKKKKRIIINKMTQQIDLIFSFSFYSDPFGQIVL